ncbi:hypothetical protein C8R46DRAFT_1057396 [Mycena filopes]|nr:hypothetical protein C8R46DRAFT_1057396 [Mycena filopes]
MTIPPHDVDAQRAGATLAGLVSAAQSEDKENPLDPIYTNVDACTALIQRRPDLLDLIRSANESKDYTDVVRHVAIQRTELKDSLNAYLTELRGPLKEFILNDNPFDRWTPDSKLKLEPDTVTHIESLGIPTVKQTPSLLIDHLGRFSLNDKLQARVDRIFQRNTTTFFVNTSGSGKTRLSLEGLCQHWGFYFILERDANSLGSADCGPNEYQRLLPGTRFSHRLPPTESPAFLPALRRNVEVIDEKFSLILLCRLLIFHLYSEIVQSEGITQDHMKKWLLFQLQPSITGDSSYDIFSELKTYAYKLRSDEINDFIAILFSKVRKIHGPDFHLFYVIDEAQLASRLHIRAFQHEGKSYPVLQEIIHCWTTKSHPHEASFVGVGTDIPKDGFATAGFSCPPRWCSETGFFDDEAEHKLYVSRFLAPSYKASPAGQVFMQRVWTWCRGRYRLTDALIKALLLDGFRTPHTLLDDYVEKVTTYRPKDFSSDEPARYTIDMKISPLNSDRFTESPLIQSTIQQVLFSYLATNYPPSPFPQEMTPLVSADPGRFADKDASEVVMDEPIFLTRTAQWFCDPPPPEPDLALSRPPPTASHHSMDILTVHRPEMTPRSLTTFLVFYLTRAFENGETLWKVFSFGEPVPKWAQQRAELVASTSKDGPLVTYIESTSSTAEATSATTLAEVETWLDRAEGETPPFCVTHTADPDLIFMLKLDDGRLVRLILRATVTDTILRKLALKKLVGRLGSDKLLREESEDTESSEHARVVTKLLDTTQPDGPFRVLRVIASFPEKTHLKTIPAAPTSSPIVNLNTGVFKRLTTDISAAEILDRLITAVTVGKRKREVESQPASSDITPKNTRVGSVDPHPAESSRPVRKRKGKERAV